MIDVKYGVVVGYDGSASADQALDWAVDEAAKRRVPLTVCHAWQPVYSGMVVVSTGEFERTAAEVAERGVRRARAAAPGLEVEPLVVQGPAVKALTHVSRSADLVVVGARGLGAVQELFLGSVSAQVAAHAIGPVVIVKGHTEPSPEYYPGRIVVGVDGSAASDQALALAFEEAVAHDVPLVAVCAWSREAVNGVLPFVGGSEVRDLAEQRFRQRVREWNAKYPAVEVYLDMRDEPVVSLMVSLAAEARMLVVGSRGLGGVRARALGSVSQAVLHRASCPVAIAHATEWPRNIARDP